MSIIKKNHNEIKLASAETQTKQFNLYFIRKDKGPLPTRLVNRLTKKSREVRNSKTRFFFKHLSSVINVIRYQMKSLKCPLISP